MATGEVPAIQSGEHLDDLLKCNICLETLKEPTLLPCLHTFCKSCIRTYFDSYNEKKNEIPCPVCRQPNPSIASSDDVETVVGELPENHFTQSLLNKASLDKSEKFCDACKFDGTEIKAISWCGTCDEALCTQCEKCHKRFKATSDHQLIHLTDLGKTRDGVNFLQAIFCDDHPKNIVQVYCVDHKKVCCALCGTFSHRKCEKVTSIEEASTGIKQKPEVSKLFKQMEEIIHLLTYVINCRYENETEIDKESTNIETTVTKMVKEIKDHLDKIQNTILSELEAAKKQTSMKVTDDINDLTSYKSAVTNWNKMLAAVVEHGSNEQCLVIMNEVAPKFEQMQNEIKTSMSKIRNNSIVFEISKYIKEFERNVKSIGDLKLHASKLKYEKSQLGFLETDFQSGEIKVVKTINVAPSGHTSGIFVENLIIFTSNKTKKVIKYSQNFELLDVFSFSGFLNDLCHISDFRIVVSSYDPSNLFIVDCEDMTILNTIYLGHLSVWGVCFYDNTQFLVGTYQQLVWIDRSSGEHVKSLCTSGHSHYALTSGKNEYLHGNGTNSVSCMVNGAKKFTYTNSKLISPRGIGIDSKRNFYIAGFGSKNIHQISDKGELIRIIPATTVGIQIPWMLRFEPGTNRFLVTCNNSGKATLCEIE